MRAYVIRRVLLLIPTLFIVTLLLPASAGFHNPPTSISAARQAMMPE